MRRYTAGMLVVVVIAGLGAIPAWHVLNTLLTGQLPSTLAWGAALIGLVAAAIPLWLAGRRFARLTAERADAADAPEGEQPLGTAFVLLVYVVVIVGMWGTMYWILLSR